MYYHPVKAAYLNGQNVLRNPWDEEYARRAIYLTGEITEESATSLSAMLRVLDRESGEDITLYIQSPGGSVYAGLSLYDTIRSLRCDVRTVACGMAASMAAFLLCAAGAKGKRYIQPHARILIHQPMGGVQGQATDIRIHAENILTMRSLYNRLLSEATGQTQAKIQQDTERDNIMDAEAAVAYGLADHIGTPPLE